MRLPYRKPGKYSQTKFDPLLTEAKFAQLKKELEKLKQKQKPAAAEVSRLAELGDFSENVEYQLAKGRLRGINQRILELEFQVNRAEIIKPKSSNVIQIGHTVTLQSGDKILVYQILGSSETNPQKGIISHTSPLGAALLGHRVGKKIIMKTTDEEIEYTVVKID
ncbi:MAG: GreA/GreB family elongation factor [Patescibacteria group bacterium]